MSIDKKMYLINTQLKIKRCADVFVAFFLSLLMMPILFAVALVIWFSSGRPVFFVQDRAGLNGKSFKIYKFRTMKQLVGEQPKEWSPNEEARITRFGRFLRDFGVDELPQLLNILKGNMSIVGPRPPLPVQADGYSERQKMMFKMRPGVLSLAAVNGRRSITVEQRIDLHVFYVEHWSLFLDASILWRSFFVVFGRRDVAECFVERCHGPENLRKNK